MRDNKGFTLMELMITMAIVAALAVIAVPNYLTWKDRQALSGEARNLKGTLEFARSRAIRDNDTVTIQFITASNRYTVSDAGGTIQERDLTTVSIESTSLSGDNVNFDRRGLPDSSGTITLSNSTDKVQLSINLIGTIRVN